MDAYMCVYFKIVDFFSAQARRHNDGSYPRKIGLHENLDEEPKSWASRTPTGAFIMALPIKPEVVSAACMSGQSQWTLRTIYNGSADKRVRKSL